MSTNQSKHFRIQVVRFSFVSIAFLPFACPREAPSCLALPALAGDLCSSLIPAIVGNVSHPLGENIQAGILSGICFPILLVICTLSIKGL